MDSPESPVDARDRTANITTTFQGGSGHWCICGKAFSQRCDLIGHMTFICTVAKRENVMFLPSRMEERLYTEHSGMEGSDTPCHQAESPKIKDPDEHVPIASEPTTGQPPEVQGERRLVLRKPKDRSVKISGSSQGDGHWCICGRAFSRQCHLIRHMSFCKVAKRENVVFPPCRMEEKRNSENSAMEDFDTPSHQAESPKLKGPDEHVPIASEPRTGQPPAVSEVQVETVLVLQKPNQDQPAKICRSFQEGDGYWCICGRPYVRGYDLIRHMRFFCKIAKRENVVFHPSRMDQRPNSKRGAIKGCGSLRKRQTASSKLENCSVKHNPIDAGTATDRQLNSLALQKLETPHKQNSGGEPSVWAVKKFHRKKGGTAKNCKSLLSGKTIWKSRWGKMVGPPWVCQCGSKYLHKPGFYEHKKLRCEVEKNATANICEGGPSTSKRTQDEHQLNKSKKRVLTASGTSQCESKDISQSGFYQHKTGCVFKKRIGEDIVDTSKPTDDEFPDSASEALVYNGVDTRCDEDQSPQNLKKVAVGRFNPAQKVMQPAEKKRMKTFIQKCPCGGTFHSIKAFYKHIVRCSSIGEPVCPCGAKLANRNSLLRHLRTVHRADLNLCGRIPGAQSKVKLKMNRGAASRSSILPHNCMCGKSFVTELRLVSHIKYACGLNLTCHLCGKNHTLKGQLQAHLVNKHSLIPETVYPFRPEDLEHIKAHPSLPEKYRQA